MKMHRNPHCLPKLSPRCFHDDNSYAVPRNNNEMGASSHSVPRFFNGSWWVQQWNFVLSLGDWPWWLTHCLRRRGLRMAMVNKALRRPNGLRGHNCCDTETQLRHFDKDKAKVSRWLGINCHAILNVLRNFFFLHLFCLLELLIVNKFSWIN